ncbi:MAG: undecaprenyl/decaprenyl-phosphate alpha-N-acetylglucosaminyl 1-phosphate transferase, partial [Eggerthellaceae bacterium]|nr:undecaprenyl/decaprenyl-phosphate alpha-N-acetylglucosaminyl 1-phosphate transferase [Eggerthellaceae bacterium]
MSEMLMHLALVGAFSFAVTFALVPAARKLAIKLHAVDMPSNRRINTTPIPRMGGVAIYVGVMAALVLQMVGQNIFGWSPILKDSSTIDLNYAGIITGLT